MSVLTRKRKVRGWANVRTGKQADKHRQYVDTSRQDTDAQKTERDRDSEIYLRPPSGGVSILKVDTCVNEKTWGKDVRGRVLILQRG
jgi:hypothetical protein